MKRSEMRGPGFRGACHRTALRADPLAPSRLLAHATLRPAPNRASTARSNLAQANPREGTMIKRLRIEPYSDYLERYRKAKSFPVSIANGFVFVSALPPFDPQTGAIERVAFESQAERVMTQLKHCLKAAGSSLSKVLKCNVYCTPSRRTSPNSTQSMTAISRATTRRGSSCRCRLGPARSMSRSIAWQWWGDRAQ